MRLQRGVTLIELIIAIVVISIALTAVMGGVGLVMGRSADPALRTQAMAIADSYLNEITGRAYFDPDTGVICDATIPAAADRPNYQKVCDFQGIEAVTEVRDATDTAIAELSAYKVLVTITPDSGAELGGIAAADAIRVDIRVNYPGGFTTLSSYRAAY